MSARQDDFAIARSPSASQPTNNRTMASNPPESGRELLCSEDIDAQIRWFFEHAAEQ